MTLKDLIEELEKQPPEKIARKGFHHPHSYRGDYCDLAFEPKNVVTAGEMLADAKSALGKTFEGWKGGDFTMNEYTECWIADKGSGGGETIGPTLLWYMFQ